MSLPSKTDHDTLEDRRQFQIGAPWSPNLPDRKTLQLNHTDQNNSKEAEPK